jgi:predicted secreted acid phosphatase
MRLRPPLALGAIATALAGLVPAGAGAAPAIEPPAPAPPASIVAYHDSGAWARDTARAIGRARWYLHTAPPRDARPALVLDVDDTSLSSYSCLKAVGFVRSAGLSCTARADLPAISDTLALYRDARERHIAVFFITGRRRRMRAATLANLRGAGFTGGWRLVMRPNHERAGQHTGFKARERRRIERRGFRIVVNVGDQASDLTGGFSMHGVKLPNPMYVIRTA